MNLTNALISVILALLAALFLFIRHRFIRGENKFDELEKNMNCVNTEIEKKVNKDYCEERRDKFQDFLLEYSKTIGQVSTAQSFILEELRKINNKGD